MRGMNPILGLFAIIGALVILCIVLKVAFALIGLIVTVGIVLVLFYFVRGAMGGRR
ncbi:MAG: hypothetical protein J0J06_06655 [Sphingomonas sp.]|uniref:hypothetical protein n=1 Tax=Sphingomonas sp. TaxID=28214 RepID=UPI001ACCDD6E|nr:hypothetical protein [Sphingomonas sp.]MBN8815111.1 hypothetical protein [Sphingomonas sp.]